MDLLEASKDDRNTQREGPDAVYAPLHPLTYSWVVPRYYHTFEKVISDIKILKYEYWHYFHMNTLSPFCLVVVILIKYNGSFS